MATKYVCPKCRTEMKNGFVLDRGDTGSKQQSAWVEGEPEPSFWSGLKTSNREVFTVQTFRCPKCNYLEFYTSERIYI
jgi:predicted nucleic-acid-binding Zn-ribbon protein